MKKMENIKGIIYFENPKGQTIGIDLNRKCYIGIKGQPVKTTPVGTKEMMRRYLEQDYVKNSFLLEYITKQITDYDYTLEKLFYHYASKIELYEKLDNVHFSKENDIGYLSKTITQYVLNHFKEYLKWTEETQTYNMRQFFSEHSYSEWMETNTLNPSQYPEGLLKWTYEKFEYVPKKYLSRVLWYITKTHLWEIDRICDDNRPLLYCLENVLHQIVTYAKKLNLKEIPKGDMIGVYYQLAATYQVKKAEIENKRLVENQTNRNLEFQYGDYTVVVPTTSDQFLDEANQQNNCVFRLYLPKVVEGITNIVFIRSNDNLQKSLVTCEVRNGDIIQFLRSQNRVVLDGPLSDFRRAYQEHLAKNFITNKK